MSICMKISRTLTNWKWYDDSATKVTFLHLLLTVNEDQSVYKETILPVGSLVTSIRALADQLNMAPNTIVKALNNLEATQDIKKTSTRRHTIITINDFEQYVSLEDDTYVLKAIKEDTPQELEILEEEFEDTNN